MPIEPLPPTEPIEPIKNEANFLPHQKQQNDLLPQQKILSPSQSFSITNILKTILEKIKTTFSRQDEHQRLDNHQIVQEKPPNKHPLELFKQLFKKVNIPSLPRPNCTPARKQKSYQDQRKIPHRAGVENGGNSCYLGAVLQALASLHSLKPLLYAYLNKEQMILQKCSALEKLLNWECENSQELPHYSEGEREQIQDYFLTQVATILSLLEKPYIKKIDATAINHLRNSAISFRVF